MMVPDDADTLGAVYRSVVKPAVDDQVFAPAPPVPSYVSIEVGGYWLSECQWCYALVRFEDRHASFHQQQVFRQ